MEFDKRVNYPCLCYTCAKCKGYERVKLGECKEIVANVHFNCEKFGDVDTLIVKCKGYTKENIKDGVLAKSNGKRTIIRGKAYEHLKEIVD